MNDDKLMVADIQFDEISGAVTFEGQTIRLTRTEFTIFSQLAAAPERIFSRRELLKCSRGMDSPSRERAVDVHVAGLRRKLGERANWIVTVRGAGYRFSVPESSRRIGSLDSATFGCHTSTKRKRVSHLRRNTLARASCLYTRDFRESGAVELGASRK